MISSLPELGRDVALLSLCLGGINTVDIFELKKENYKDGIIGYKRAKTKHSRKDEAYIEMRVEPFIQATFDKYLSDEDDEYLFKFHKRYSNPDSFNANVNIGIRKICADMGMKRRIITVIILSVIHGLQLPKMTVMPICMKLLSA